MSRVHDIIQDPSLAYHQQVLALARLAENEDDSLLLELAFQKVLETIKRCVI